MKQYKLGFIIGRFQPLHKGHINIIKKGLELCDKVVVLIGSANKFRTLDNPLFYAEREQFIRQTFEDYPANELEILPLRDVGVGNGKEWGEYVLTTLDAYGHHPDLYISGEELVRKGWFDGLNTQFDILTVNRKWSRYSGTKVREALLADNKEEFLSQCGFILPYEELRDILKEIAERKDIECN